MNSNDIILFYSETEPRKIWEMDNKTLSYVKTLKDGCGTYLWTPEPNYKDMPGRLLGVQIAIAREKCFQLRHEYTGGHVEIIKMEI